MDKARFVADGLRHGFDCGVDRTKLFGHRYFKNYPSAIAERSKVTRAVNKRLLDHKTLDLGLWSAQMRLWLGQIFAAAFIFPMGSTPKALEPEVVRPTSDHTRTGLNAATDMSRLRYGLFAHKEVASRRIICLATGRRIF